MVYKKIKLYLIINKALKEKIKLIIIGYNEGWKNEINIGMTTESFMSIPHLKLVEYIEYKAKLYGIKTIRQEESYTSKADALALDYIPIYEKSGTNIHKFSGKRKLRGLYQLAVGKLINADVNGALNIMRKYFQNLSVACDSLIQEIMGSTEGSKTFKNFKGFGSGYVPDQIFKLRTKVL